MASPFDITGETLGAAFGWIVETVTGKAARKIPMTKKAAWILVVACIALLSAIPYLRNHF